MTAGGKGRESDGSVRSVMVRTRRAFVRSRNTALNQAVISSSDVVRKIGSCRAARAALRSAAACDLAPTMGSLGVYKTKPRGMLRRSSRARMRAATSRSERALWRVAMLRGRRLRSRVVCDFDCVVTEAELDEEERLEVDIHARAHREIACSTPAEMAPRRPPNTDTVELELEDEDEGDDDGTGDGDLGGRGVGGGGPR